jgi:predicted transcriptional regulator
MKFIPQTFQNKDIATEVQISEAEVSESLRRSAYAGLITDPKLKRVNKKLVLGI